MPTSTLKIENVLWEFLVAINQVDMYGRGRVVADFASKMEGVKTDDYLTERQVASRWPALFTRRWLQESRRLRKGPTYGVINRRVVYRKVDIEAYIERHFVRRSYE